MMKDRPKQAPNREGKEKGDREGVRVGRPITELRFFPLSAAKSKKDDQGGHQADAAHQPQQALEQARFARIENFPPSGRSFLEICSFID